MIKKTEKKVKEKEVELKTPFVMIGGKSLKQDHVNDEGHVVYKTKSEGADWEFILCPKSSLVVESLVKGQKKGELFRDSIRTIKVDESTVRTQYLEGHNTIFKSVVDVPVLESSMVFKSNVTGSGIKLSHIEDSYVENSTVVDSYIYDSKLSTPEKWKVIKSSLNRVNKFFKTFESDEQGYEVTVLASFIVDVNLFLRGKRHVIANTSIRGADIFRRNVVVTDHLKGGEDVLYIRSLFDILNVAVNKDTHLLMTRMANGTFVVSFGRFNPMVKIDHDLLEKGRDGVRAAIEEISWGKGHIRRGEFGNSLIEHVVSMILSRIEVSKVVNTSAENLDYLGIRPGRYGYFSLETDPLLDSINGYGPSDNPF